MNSLLIALQFLTRLPLPHAPQWTAQAWGSSVLWFPWVGLFLGLALALPLWWLDSPWLAAALALSIWILLTGALHLDGLADLADAWIGGQGDRTRTLDIMKDPRCGPMAVVAVVMLLLLKFAALVTLALAGAPWAVVLVPALARCACLIQLMQLRPARTDGLAASLAPLIPKESAWLSIAGLGLLSLLMAPTFTLLAVLGGWVLLALLKAAFEQRIGGVTGDTLGATVELAESLLLILLALRYEQALT